MSLLKMAQKYLKKFSNKNNFFKNLSLHHKSLSLSSPQRSAVIQNPYLSHESSNKPKPFSAIPGPSPLPIIGNLWRYLPFIGEYRLDSMEGNGKFNLARYGKIVREHVTASHKILHLFDPAHIEEMFRQEDRYPYRRSHRALLKFRRERPHLYGSGGIFPENGPEWARLRDIFKRHFLLPQNINPYDSLLSKVADDTIDLLRSVRNESKVVANLQNEMYKWSLESICAILLDSRIGCLAPNLRPDSDASRLIDAGNNTIQMVAQTELYAGWEKHPNKAYRSLEKSQDVMSEIVYKHFINKLKQIDDESAQLDKETDLTMIHKQTHNDKHTQEHKSTGEIMKKSPEKSDPETLLTQFIRNRDIDRKDLFGMLVDSVMAGIDTTSITASFVCYFLSENAKYQTILRNEIQDALQTHGVDSLKAEHFAQMPWLKAIIKETLRLRPIAVGVGRLTSRECLIGGYKIPPNTMIITQNQVSCLQAEYFNDPETFMPERWFDNQTKQEIIKRKRQTTDPSGKRFLWLPFGHGPRMCLGRRIAELELYILISKIISQFTIEPEFPDADPSERVVNTKTMLINIPDRPIRLRLIDIKKH